MFNILKKFIQHGVVTVEYPKKPIRTEIITGRPEFSPEKCIGCSECIKRCPSGAISYNSQKNGNEEFRIEFNLKECLFCSLCADICLQGAINMTHDFELSTKGDGEYVESGYELMGEKLKEKIKKHFGRSLQIREVDAGSCNGCDNEVNALNSPYNDVERFGIHFVASPRHADMLLVTGPVTRNMELALVKTYNAVPDPKMVIAAGACACSGGIFKDSYATRNGIDKILPVDIYIPGCPPRPQALMHGILMAIERLEKK